jgi:trans-aconitate methyltransferase
VKTSKNTQVAVYKKKRKLKQHELEFKNLIKRLFSKHFQGDFLDIGCATGNAIKILKKLFPNSSITGIDINKKLIRIASKRVNQGTKLINTSIEKYIPKNKFDLIIASGVLSIFNDCTENLKTWISWLKPKGILYIFGRFNSADIDTVIYFRNLKHGNKWETGLTSFSLKTVKKFLEKQNVTFKFIRFKIKKDLKKQKNPICSFTQKLKNNSRIVINGANVIAEHFHLLIKKLPLHKN